MRQDRRGESSVVAHTWDEEAVLQQWHLNLRHLWRRRPAVPQCGSVGSRVRIAAPRHFTCPALAAVSTHEATCCYGVDQGYVWRVPRPAECACTPCDEINAYERLCTGEGFVQ